MNVRYWLFLEMENLTTLAAGKLVLGIILHTTYIFIICSNIFYVNFLFFFMIQANYTRKF